MSKLTEQNLEQIMLENRLFKRALRNIAASSDAVSMGSSPKKLATAVLQRAEHVSKVNDES